MITCILCKKPAQQAMTWLNSNKSKESLGAGIQGGPMCEACMELMWASLDKFPLAKQTLTIWPLTTYFKEVA